MSGLKVYREGIIRNRKCLLAYIQHRSAKIRKLRWQVGHPLPQKFKDRMSPDEYQYFTGYDEILTKFQTQQGTFQPPLSRPLACAALFTRLAVLGVDLSTHLKPPKSLYITVRALVDCGSIVGDDGTSIRLEQHSENLVRRQDVVHLIRQGHLKEV